MDIFTSPVNDSFKNGGYLVDEDYWFAARDKIQHLAAGMFLFLLLRILTPLSTGALFGIVLLLGLVWELFELYNYKKGKLVFADLISWRDMVANMAGALLGFVVTLPNNFIGNFLWQLLS